MHLTTEEALLIIDDWKLRQTMLQVRLPGSSVGVRASILTRIGTRLTLKSELNESIDVDLAGVDSFNGDGRASTSVARHGAYLVCELKNSDRVSFYVL